MQSADAACYTGFTASDSCVFNIQAVPISELFILILKTAWVVRSPLADCRTYRLQPMSPPTSIHHFELSIA